MIVHNGASHIQITNSENIRKGQQKLKNTLSRLQEIGSLPLLTKFLIFCLMFPSLFSLPYQAHPCILLFQSQFATSTHKCFCGLAFLFAYLQSIVCLSLPLLLSSSLICYLCLAAPSFIDSSSSYGKCRHGL